MSEEHHIKTDFMDRQARESATPFMQKFPVRVMAVLLAVGILYGGYNLVMYFMNLEKNQAINNVGVTLQAPDLQDGVARVDVTISNLNAVPVDHIQFKYTINLSLIHIYRQFAKQLRDSTAYPKRDCRWISNAKT